MKTVLDCIPCFARQALEAARFVTDDPTVQERVLRDVLRSVAEMDWNAPPPVAAQRIHRTLRRITGADDPYRAVKDHFNRMARAMLGELSARVRDATDPWDLALRLVIAANVIDLGLDGDITENDVRQAMNAVGDEPFYGDVEAFRRAVARAEKILYLADNAGEIVFDRLLIEQLPRGRVTVAVRGGPILNDATRLDAEAAELDELAEIIDNGSDAPGTILPDCSEEFRRRFTTAELIIAKGQGNFETLNEENGEIYFLFKVKCPVIAERVGLPVGTHVVLHRRISARQQTVAVPGG